VSILTISLTVERARNVFVSNSVRTRMQRRYLSEFCLFFSPSPYALNELTTEDMRNAGNKSKLNNAERKCENCGAGLNMEKKSHVLYVTYCAVSGTRKRPNVEI